MKLFFLLLFFIFFSFCAHCQNRLQDLKNLVQVESEFNQAVKTKGINKAFLTYYAEDAITLAPFPINGKKFYSEKEPDPGIFNWKPALADVSFSGDLGYTTGPWVYQNNKEDNPIAFGYYVTIWKKQIDGQLKAVLDIGISNSPHALKETKMAFAKPQEFEAIENASKKKRKTLLATDSLFSEVTKREGLFKAYEKYLSDECRVMREGHSPSTERTKILDSLSEENSKIIWKPIFASVSADEGLGYTYGSGEVQDTTKLSSNNTYFMYLKIWKRDEEGEFKIVVDVIKPTDTQYKP